MSAPQFTPGPWADEYADADEAIFVSAGAWPYGSTICEISLKQKPRDGANEANGRLIAAAPELFAELQQFVNGVETGMISGPAEETLANITHRAKAVLAKAQGHD